MYFTQFKSNVSLLMREAIASFLIVRNHDTKKINFPLTVLRSFLCVLSTGSLGYRNCTVVHSLDDMKHPAGGGGGCYARDI